MKPFYWLKPKIVPYNKLNHYLNVACNVNGIIWGCGLIFVLLAYTFDMFGLNLDTLVLQLGHQIVIAWTFVALLISIYGLARHSLDDMKRIIEEKRHARAVALMNE